MRIEVPGRATLLVLLLAGLVGPGAGAASAQVEDLARDCHGTSLALYPHPLAGPCGDGALLAQAAQAGVGLAQAGPGTLVGSSSTLGRRFGSTPRVVLSLRGGLTRVPLPDTREEPTGNLTATVPSIHAAVVAGVFDGFMPKPTVGGLLAVDLLLTGDWAFLPDGAGFDGSSAAWGYGLRLGVLRESFTLPGITLSATRRHGGSFTVQPGPVGTPRVDMDVTTTSVRGEVGKELAGFGFLGGLGWDRYSSDVELDVSGGLPDPPVEPVSASGFDSGRALAFAGISRTFLVVQLAGELGYAWGFDAPPPDGSTYDAGEGSLFGTLSFRLTF